MFKPRGQWHTWNAGEDVCEIIEIITPGGFEDYFREVADAWGDVEAFAAINDRYDLDMDFESVPGLCERFGLTFPELQRAGRGVPARANRRSPTRRPWWPWWLTHLEVLGIRAASIRVDVDAGAGRDHGLPLPVVHEQHIVTGRDAGEAVQSVARRFRTRQ